MSAAREPVGSLDVALGHATRLLRKNPLLAAEQAAEILKVVPGHPRARLVLVRQSGCPGEAKMP